MNNITSDEQQIHDDTPLTRTQVEALFRELEEQRNRERNTNKWSRAPFGY